jgi:hypothetical protein
MNSQSKNEMGELLDIQDGVIIAETAVKITLSKPEKENEHPKYQVFIIMDGYRPELNGKSFILKLATISGEVFLTMTGIPDGYEHRFAALLHGRAWQNTDWFDSL